METPSERIDRLLTFREHQPENDPACEYVLTCLYALEQAYREVRHKHRDGCGPFFEKMGGCSFCEEAEPVSWLLRRVRQPSESELFTFGMGQIEVATILADWRGIELPASPVPRLLPIDGDLAEAATALSGGFPGAYLSKLFRPLLQRHLVSKEADAPAVIVATKSSRRE